MITDTPTMKQTLERILETQQITDNIRAAVQAGEITEAQAREIISEVLK
jgi:hypothetical protein